MKILITGGAGFIGSSLIPELTKFDHEIHVIDNLSFGSRKYAKVSDRFFSKVDIREKDKVEKIKQNKEKVKNLGGLFIVGTERHESRRIDNQLRGRSGRQGDPGSSVFYISLEDDLMRIFGGGSIDGMLKKLGLKKN